jgi:LmbE family N-acetylglucosaminyl deacetylase
VDNVNPTIPIRAIAEHIRRVRPHVVVTFGPEAGYGHPDHIAISQFTTAAIVCTGDAGYRSDSLPAHRVAKLYYMAWPNGNWDAYQAAFRKLSSMVHDIARQATPWPDWAVTTAYGPVVWKAVCCHQTQMSI